MLIDKSGFRLNIGIILVNNSKHIFWGKRQGHDAWQFPQGGLYEGERPVDALFRELREEIGLEKIDVEILGVTKRWFRYRLPKKYLRHGSNPLVVGQKQKWFLLKLINNDQKISLNLSDYPEFDSWRWIEYSEAADKVIFFKKQVYVQVIKEFEALITK
jgi:putative (di)nucleoside polyphosphate hydrolase